VCVLLVLTAHMQNTYDTPFLTIFVLSMNSRFEYNNSAAELQLLSCLGGVFLYIVPGLTGMRCGGRGKLRLIER